MTQDDKSAWGQRRIVRTFLTMVLSLTALNLLFPIVWFSLEIGARVVTPSGRPIEGAIVAANWRISDWARRSLGQLEIVEVVTDKDGWFRIPRWGPRFVWHGTLLESEPMVRVFHPNFVPLVMHNAERGWARELANRILRFRMQDQEIPLKPFYGSFIDYERELLPLTHSLDVFLMSQSRDNECLRKDMPKLLNAMQRIKDAFQREGAGASIRSLDAYSEYCPWRIR